jgi:hypothetical protein
MSRGRFRLFARVQPYSLPALPPLRWFDILVRGQHGSMANQSILRKDFGRIPAGTRVAVLF